MIIAFQHQKGGTGKSTLALNVASTLGHRGARVLYIDADSQCTGVSFTKVREADSLFTTVSIPTPTVHKEVRGLAQAYDHIIIDGPARVGDQAKSVILAADVVVIPTTPSPFDVWSATEIVREIQGAIVFKETLKAVFAINRRIKGTAIGRDVVEALADQPFPVLQAAVSQRVIYPEASSAGMAVFEADPKGPAAAEIAALTDELLGLAS